MSRRNLAERLGLPASTVARWESENESVPVEYLGKLAETLHVPLEDLLALHAQSVRRLRARSGAALSAKRMLKYPVKGTLEEMLELGGAVASGLHLQLELRLDVATYQDEVLLRFPRDSALQLLAVHHFLGCGADLRRVCLLDLGCPMLITQRKRKVYDGDRDMYALLLPGDDWLMVLVPQVSMGVPACPEIYRCDFLGLYVDNYGHRHWIDITIDDAPKTTDPHADCPSVLGMPRFRYNSEQVLKEDFAPNMLAEVRRFMMSDVVHRGGVVTVRVRQPKRFDAPVLKSRNDPEPAR